MAGDREREREKSARTSREMLETTRVECRAEKITRLHNPIVGSKVLHILYLKISPLLSPSPLGQLRDIARVCVSASSRCSRLSFSPSCDRSYLNLSSMRAVSGRSYESEHACMCVYSWKYMRRVRARLFPAVHDASVTLARILTPGV